eukprot:1174376-Prymnesium_polylepis.1
MRSQHRARMELRVPRLSYLGDVGAEAAASQVAVDDRLVDGLEHLHVGEEGAEGGEVALHPVDDVEGAGGRVHRAHVLHALDELHRELLEVVEAA